MIVIDTNILIYSLIECEHTTLTALLRDKDADWRTPPLCLHETLNVLATYQRRGLLSHAQCRKLLDHATRFIEEANADVDLDAALGIAVKHALTGYDAEYVALAQHLQAPLITEDRKLRQAVPRIAFSIREFLEH